MIDLDGYRAQARAWLAENLEPRSAARGKGPSRGHGLEEPEDYLPARALQRRLFDAGYAGIDWPAEYGGQGLPAEYARAFAEEALDYALPDLGHAGGTTYGPCGRTLAAHGSPEFLAEHMPRMLAGEELFVQLFSEPGAGSDMAGITTKAVRDGEDWVITGSKIWTSGANYADYGMCLARTNWDVPKHRGLTWFAVPLRAAGVTVRPIREITGGAEFCEEFLDGVRVSAKDVIGEVDQGWTVAQTMLTSERGAGRDDPRNMPSTPADEIDPQLLAVLRRAGRTQDPVARQTLAKIHTGDWMRALMGARVGALMQHSSVPAGALASYWKLSEGVRAPERARMQMEIGAGVPVAWEREDAEGDLPALAYLNSRIWSIAGGSNEMQRNAISEQALGLPREFSADRGKPFREVVSGAKDWGTA
jgi:alkylation response protein AidB-like acyl-CoA dehydrogenase